MQQGCGRWGWSETPRDFAPGQGACGWFVSWFFSPGLGGGGKASLVGSPSHLQIRGRLSPRRRQQHRDPGLCVGDPHQRCCAHGPSAAAEPGWAPRAAVGVVHPHDWSIRVNPSGSVRHVSLGSHVPTGARSASPVLLAAAFPGPPVGAPPCSPFPPGTDPGRVPWGAQGCSARSRAVEDSNPETNYIKGCR